MKKIIALCLSVVFMLQLCAVTGFFAVSAAFTGTEVFFEDDFTEVPEEEIFNFNTGGSGSMTRNPESGEMIIKVQSYCLPDFVMPTIIDTEHEKIVFEIKINNHGGDPRFVKLRVGNGASNGWSYGYRDIYTGDSSSCRMYVLLDRGTGTASVYKEGSAEPVAVDTGYFPQGDMQTWKAVQLMVRVPINSPSKSVNIDYAAAYTMPDSFDFSVGSVTKESAVLITSHPLLLDDSTAVTVNGVPAALRREEEKHNTYNIIFAAEPEGGAEYTAELPQLLCALGGGALTEDGTEFTIIMPYFDMPQYTPPKELFFENFNELPEQEEMLFNTSSSGTMMRDTEHSEMVVKVGGYCTPDLGIPEITDSESAEVIFEVETSYNNGTWMPKLRAGTASVWTKNYTDIKSASSDQQWFNTASRLYIAYNRDNGTVTVYEEGNTEPVSELSGFPCGAAAYPRLQLMCRNSINSSAKAVCYDYFAVYENPKDFSFMIEDSEGTSNEYLLLKTTKPISVKDTAFTVNGAAAALSKVPDSFLTYKVTFGRKLSPGGEYILSSNKICGLDGRNYIYEENMPFTVQPAQSAAELAELSDFTVTVNGEQTDCAFEQGNICASAEVYALGENVPVTMAAAGYKNGRLTEFKTVNEIVSGSQNVQLNFVPDNTDNTELKLFMLDSMNKIAPLKEAKTLNKRTGEKIYSVDSEFFPGWVRKAVTFSYDDNSDYDEPLLRLFRKYGIKGTFNIVPDWIGNGARRERFRTRYAGQETASHSWSHPNFTTLTEEEIQYQIDESKSYIEELFGTEVKGFAWPYNDPNISSATEYLKETGFIYARPSSVNGSFDIPEDWLKWNMTCKHEQLTDYSGSFFALETEEMKMFSIWGHSNELASDWSVMEDFLKQLSERSDIWNPTNAEAVEYINAVRGLEITESYIRNPSEVTVYAEVNGSRITIGGGSTYRP